MTKLPMFGLMEQAAELLGQNMPVYSKAASGIVEYLYNILYSNTKEIIGISSRIKTPDSLKEKIIRNKLYLKYTDPALLLDELEDIIGIRVECRFIKNELEVLEIIRERFYRADEQGFYHNPKQPGVFLQLDVEQPRMQKNGFPIYRLDGYILSDGRRVNFELQIRSMVQLFWSDIEHKIVYKNNVYMPNDGFIRELLASVRDNLIGVDSQLRLLYDRLYADDPSAGDHRSVDDRNMRTAIAKTISDLFCSKMEESIGFTVDFKRSCDILSTYILNKNRELSADLFRFFLFDLTGKMKQIAARQISFETRIEFRTPPVLEEGFCKIIGERLLSLINRDFEWYLFFKILFELEPGESDEDFTLFLRVLKVSFSDTEIYEPLYTVFRPQEVELLREELLSMAAESLASNASIAIIYDENLRRVREALAWSARLLADNMAGMECWNENRARFLPIFRQRLTEAVSAK